MASILAVESFLPPGIVTNDDLSSYMETSDEWIVQRSGIRERRWVRRGNENFRGIENAEMAFQAAQKAFAGSGAPLSDIDAIIYATVSPDHDLPGSGAALKARLGIGRAIPVLEVRNQCSGFLFSLSAACAYINGGAFRQVLVVASEIQSSGLDLSTEGRGTAVLFADGCGVAIVGPDQPGAHKVLACELHSDGRFADKLGVRCPGFAKQFLIDSEKFSGADKELFPHMEGRFIFHMASQKMPESVRNIALRCGHKTDEIEWIVPHQANQRILDMLSAEFEGKIKVFSNIAHYGNTTSASIPIALSEAQAQGLINSGSLVCLTTFGSGVSWGAILLRW